MRTPIYIFVILFIFIAIGIEYFRLNTKETITAKVTHKENLVRTKGEKVETFYLIFTDGGTFELSDELIFCNFRSSDWFGDIQPGETYEFDVVGWRSGFLSMYQNIVG